MQSGAAAAGGVGLGAGLMYLFDPDKGKRRRAFLGNQLLHTRRRVCKAVSKTVRDLDHHMRGLAAQLGARCRADHPTDAVLAERVRAKIGRVLTFPSAVTVRATAGHVTVSGPVLASEIHRLLAHVKRVRGVKDVDNQLEALERKQELRGLQDRMAQRALQLEPLHGNWSPTERAAAVAVGGALAVYGLRRRDRAGTALAALGLGVLVRGFTNVGLRRLIGVGVGRRAVDVQKTISIAAPVDQVYALWCHPEQFPRFMAHVRHVRQIADDRTHWIVDGPLGIPVAWDVEVTLRVSDELLTWHTLPGSLVSHAGTVRFESGDGTTRIDIHMRYSPPAGVLGHALATVLGADPRHVLDEDLLRFKSLMEMGKTHVHGAVVTREEVLGERGAARAGR